MALSPTDRELVASERRDRIVEASRRIFLEKGLVKTRTREIAEAAGVKEAILYTHFASKEEIFSAAIFDPLERLVTDIVQRAELLSSADEQTQQRGFVESLGEITEVMVEIVPLLGVALYSDLAIGRQFFAERLQPLFEQWFALTARSMSGISHRDADPRAVAMAGWGMPFGLALDAAMKGEKLDVRRTARQVGDLLYYGLLGPVPSQTKARVGR